MSGKPIVGILLGDEMCIRDRPSGIGKRCRERGIPVAAIVGGMGDKAETIFDYGIDSIMTTTADAAAVFHTVHLADGKMHAFAQRRARLPHRVVFNPVQLELQVILPFPTRKRNSGSVR